MQAILALEDGRGFRAKGEGGSSILLLSPGPDYGTILRKCRSHIS